MDLSDLRTVVNSHIKGPLQEYRERQNLRKCKRILARTERPVPTARDEVETALRKRLAQRGLPRVRSESDLHIFLLYRKESWTSILPRSLEPFGKVTEFDFNVDFPFTNLTEWLALRPRVDAAMWSTFAEAHARRPIDAVIGYVSGASTDPAVLRRMAETGAVIFNFCWDDKLDWPGRLLGDRPMSTSAIAHSVDLNLTNAPDSLYRYASVDGLSMFWPEAAEPTVHRPYDVNFDYDVSFVGARYGWRPNFIDKLTRLGVRVECFGPGWPNGPLSEIDMVRLYSRSRINLGFGGVGHSRRLRCLKGRDFEVPMSGGLYLTQNNPELDLVYDVGNEIVTYEDEHDCARAIRALIDEPERAARIRAAGRQRALRDHSYHARWSELFLISGLSAAQANGSTSIIESPELV